MPDEVPAEGLDLRSYYLENRTYFWSLFLLLAVSGTASMATYETTSGMIATDVVRSLLASGNLTLVVFSLVLIATARRWIYSAMVLFMLVALVWVWVSPTISG